MSNSTEIKAIESNIKQAKALVELGTALDRLRSNSDFKKIVGEGYFEAEAVRLVHLKADSNMQTAAYQESIVKQMDAIGAFSQFLMTLAHRARMAEGAVSSDEETLNELLAEEI